jgi:hypothetical protein
MQTEVALAALLRRFPDLALAGHAGRVPDPGSWRLTSLPVTVAPGTASRGAST